MIKKFIHNNLGKTWQEAAETTIGLALFLAFWVGLFTNGFRDFSRGPITWTDIFSQLFM